MVSTWVGNVFDIPLYVAIFKSRDEYEIHAEKCMYVNETIDKTNPQIFGEFVFTPLKGLQHKVEHEVHLIAHGFYNPGNNFERETW